MDNMIDASIPVEHEAAAALAIPRDRAAAGRADQARR